MVSRRNSGEAGYNLVFLMVIVTVLNILVAAALPHWTTRAQREREEEAIFRGLQYAEAIRVFQNRFGRPPVRLQELVEVEPRSIRQLWGDPLNDDGEWGVLFAGQGGGTVRPDAGGGGDDSGNLSGDSGLGPASGQGGNQQQTQGPIAGVYSRAQGDAIKVFNGAESYEDWEFTVTMVTQLMTGGAAGPGNQAPANDPNGRPQNPQNPQNPGQPGQPGAPGLIQPGAGPPDLSVRWLGRPWPEEIQSQMDAGAAMNQGAGPGGPGAPGQPASGAGPGNPAGGQGAQGGQGTELGQGGDGGKQGGGGSPR